MLNTSITAALSSLRHGPELSDGALAYIGPGAGLGGVAVAAALVLGVLFLLFGLVWYPLKRMVSSRREAGSGMRPTDETGG